MTPSVYSRVKHVYYPKNVILYFKINDKNEGKNNKKEKINLYFFYIHNINTFSIKIKNNNFDEMLFQPSDFSPKFRKTIEML